MNEKMLNFAVLALIERDRTVSIPQLARMLNAEEEAVSKALETLLFCYDSVFVRLNLENNYATLLTNETSRLLRLSEKETEVLLDALRTSGIPEDSDLIKTLVQAKGFLTQDEALPSPKVRTSVYTDTAILMKELACACEDEEHHLLVIEHQKEGEATPLERIVEPYGISSDGDGLYLQAYCHMREAFRSFRIDRIRDARRSEDTFVPRDDAAGYFAAKQRGEMASILFKEGSANPEWPGLKKVEEKDDGSWIGQIRWYGSMWLPKQVVSCLGCAIPLDPPELVEMTRNYATSLKEAATTI